MKSITSMSRRKVIVISGALVAVALLIVVPWALDARRPRIMPVPPGAMEVNGGLIDTTTGLITVYLPGNRVQEALAFYEKALRKDKWSVGRVVATIQEERDHNVSLHMKPMTVQAAPAILANGQPNYGLRASRRREGNWSVTVFRQNPNLPNERTLITVSSDRGVRRQTATSVTTPYP